MADWRIGGEGWRSLGSRARVSGVWPWPVLGAIAALAGLSIEVIWLWVNNALTIQDDAYYYLVIARNIVHHGVSSFDLQSQTNGYHPLWLALLVLQDLVVGPSILATELLQAFLLAGGVYFILSASPAGDRTAQALLAAVVAVLIGHFGLGGMEVALVVFCAGGLAAAIQWARPGGVWRGVGLGLVAAACIGARIDAAAFVIPALVAAPIGRKARVSALATVAGFGAVYAMGDLWAFGMATPVSSAVKSLGGPQINRPLIGQLAKAFTPGAHAFGYLLTFVALAVSPVLIRFSRPGSTARALAWASCLGGAIYVGKLIFWSPWIVWPWYNYAVIFPLMAAYLALEPLWAASGFRLPWRAEQWAPIALLGLTLVAPTLTAPRAESLANDYAAINRLTVQRFGPTLGGARVAMGDRAGSFADAYDGPVVQLEGLTNDKAYLGVLRRRGDLRGLLCRRGVRYIIDYEPDLGSYAHFQIPALRPTVTQFQGPSVDVWREDEVDRVRNLPPPGSGGDRKAGEDTLYIWRLRCGAASS